MMKITLLTNQRLIDACLMSTGDEGRVFEIADLNGTGITDNVVAGQVVDAPDADVAKRGIAATLQRIPPASGPCTKKEGLNYWSIGMDFIIRENQN